MSDVVAAVSPDCPRVPDDAQWNEMYQTELLCGKEAKDIPEKLVDEVLREVDVRRAKALQLVGFMHRKCIITSDEHQQLTNPQTTDLMRGNLLTRILMGKEVHWLLKFCHCLLESYESERGLDIHYTLLQRIKGELHYRLKEDPLQQEQIEPSRTYVKELYTPCYVCNDVVREDWRKKSKNTAFSTSAMVDSKDVANNIKSVPITHDVKERLMRRLNIEGYRHLLDNLNQVTTSDVADAWLSADVTRDWTVLVEALFTERGLGCAVSGVLPLSSSNPPAVWNYVRDMGNDWEHLARFLGYSDDLISEIKSKSNWDVKSQIHSFMRVCLIPDCGELRTEEIMKKIKNFLSQPSQSDHVGDHVGDHKSMHPPESKGAAKSRHVVFADSASLYKGDHLPIYQTDTKDHHVPLKETGDLWLRKFHHDQAHPQMPGLIPDRPVVHRMDNVSTEIKKTSVDRSEDDGQELLQACTSEQWDVAEALINSGAMLEAQDKDGRTPLHICCIKGKMEMVKLLIESGSNVTAKDKLDNCCLHHKETLKNHIVASLIISAFVQKDTSVDQPNKNEMTPLMVACRSGEIYSQAALILIRFGARVDGLPNVKDKPLICASASGNTKLVEHLLTYGADINQKDGRDGSTALIQACLCNHPGIVKILLESKPNVNLADKDGTTALAAAVSKNAYEMVQMLIEKGGADVNCTRHRDGIIGSHEETPLASACARGYRDVAELLICNGANVNYLCSDTVPPIGFAIICKQQHMIRFLSEVEVYDKSIYGLRRAVDIAVRAGNYAAVKILLDARGGPELVLQEAQQNHLSDLAGHIQLIQSFPEAELMHSTFEEPAVMRGASSQMRDQSVKVEEVLQMFSQICMSAITSNKDCEQFLGILKALKAPRHISSFIQEFYRGTQRPDILKATFLGSDTGTSPANFLIAHQFVDAVRFHVHAMEFFPDGPEKFYEELVWTFHQISGGEDLPYDVNRVLDRMFSGHFSLNVRTATIGGHVPIQYPNSLQAQPHPMVPSHEGQYTSTALPRPTLNGVDMGRSSSSQPPTTALHGVEMGQPSSSKPPTTASHAVNMGQPSSSKPPTTASHAVNMGQPSLSQPPTQASHAVNVGQPSLSQPPTQASHAVNMGQPSFSQPPTQASHAVNVGQPSFSQPPTTASHAVNVGQPSFSQPPTTASHAVNMGQPSLSQPPTTASHAVNMGQPSLSQPPTQASHAVNVGQPSLSQPPTTASHAVNVGQPSFSQPPTTASHAVKEIPLHGEEQNKTAALSTADPHTPSEHQESASVNKTDLTEGFIRASVKAVPHPESLWLPAARKLTTNQTTTEGHLSDAETPEEERKNEFGDRINPSTEDKLTPPKATTTLREKRRTTVPPTTGKRTDILRPRRMPQGTQPPAQASSKLSATEGKQLKGARRTPQGTQPPAQATSKLSAAEGKQFKGTGRMPVGKQPPVEVHHKSTAEGKQFKGARRIPHAKPSPVQEHPKMSTMEEKHSDGRQTQLLRLEIKDVIFLGKRIGEGAFGYVEEVEVKGKIYAGKQFKDDRNLNKKTFLGEFQIMQTLQHDHIVDYYGFHIREGNKPPVLIMERLETNLHDFLLSESNQNLPLERKVDLLYGIAQGLNYLHRKSVIHRDLTATNVLLDSRAVPKISDFGNSCVTGIDLGSELHSQSLTRCPGTLMYMAPEAQSSTKYGTEIDIFSFGHLSLFVGIQQSPNHLLPHIDPEADDDDDSVCGRTEVKRRQEYFTLLYEKLEEKHPLVLLMKTCLRNNLKRRPKANELVAQLESMRRELPSPPPVIVRMSKHRK